ncbi:hypothetical protein D3C72_1544300 [compost metagenome]
MAKFAVVIVFDDQGASGARAFEQRHAARGTEHAARRILVRRRRVDQARRCIAPVLVRRRDAIDVDGDTRHLQAGATARRQRAAIAGMLDPQGIALVGKGAQADIEAALRAVRDEHLARIADDAARGAQMLGDGHA